MWLPSSMSNRRALSRKAFSRGRTDRFSNIFSLLDLWAPIGMGKGWTLAPPWRLERWEAAAVDCCPDSYIYTVLTYWHQHFGPAFRHTNASKLLASGCFAPDPLSSPRTRLLGLRSQTPLIGSRSPCPLAPAHPWKNFYGRPRFDLELWTMTLTMACKFYLNRVKINLHAEYLGQRSCRSKVIVRTQRNTQTDTHKHTINRLLYTATIEVGSKYSSYSLAIDDDLYIAPV